MDITFDPAKRAKTLRERGLDFVDASLVFDAFTVTNLDERFDYGEIRWITAGYLRDRFVVVVWTERLGARRIISMRYGHDNEEARFARKLGRSG